MARGRTRTNRTYAPSSVATHRASTSRVVDAGDNSVASKREALILDRQGELDRVLDRHDGLVREVFHMEEFRTLLKYDPVEAKEDQTPVFLEYKAKHDLAMNTPSSGPSRTTRRAQNERIALLKHRLLNPSSASQSISAPIIPSRNNAKTRSQTSTSISATPKDVRQKRSAPRLSTIVKGKQKEGISYEEPEVDTNAVVVNGGRPKRLSSKVQGKRKAADKTPASASRVTRSQSALTESTSSHSIAVSTMSTRRSRRDKVEMVNQPSKEVRLKDKELESHLRISIPPSPSKFASSSIPRRPSVSGKTVGGKTLPLSSGMAAAAARPTIRRVRLIVREPPPTISSPLQRPRPPLFGRSLPALLSSYVEIDGQEYDTASLERAARHDAQILHKAEVLKKEGRLFLGANLGLDPGRGAPAPRPRDVWAAVTAEAIAARNALPRHRFGRGGVLASSVHVKLHAHWDMLKTREEREIAAEEKRLRALAKTILRLVLGEWKKVVFHVREEERRVLEAEEKRLGRQHLDAILDQSGQILERQQMDLVRTDVTRSRSSTVSIDDEEATNEDDENIPSGGEGASEVDDETERASNEDSDDAETANVGSEVGEVEDVDSSALINGSTPASRGGNRYIDFKAPLNDIDMEEEYPPAENGTQDVRSFSNEMDEDADEEDVLRSELETNDVGNKEIHQERVFDESEYVLDQDDDSRDDEARSFAGVDSLRTSLESTPFIDDLHIYGNEMLRLGLDMEPALVDLQPPALDLSHDLGNESLLVSSGAVSEGRQGSLPPVSKLLLTAVDPVESFEEHFADGDVRPKLLNGSSPHFDGKSTGVHSGEQTAIEPAPLKVNSFIAETDVRFPSEDVDMHSPYEYAIDPDAAILDSHDRDEHPTDGQKESLDDDNGRATAADDHPTESDLEWEAPLELQPYAVARVNWTPEMKIVPPLLLRGTLRPYQQSGLEWLATLHNNKMNGILADEMGLGKTIQTIALLAHLACDRGIWGPHLIIVPTSVLLNWEMEFKKFLPGFKILSYHGTTKRRKELRQGWNNKHAFNACVTSYTLASRDQHIFKRKAWYYMILDEAHMIKNFKSQRWNILLMFRSSRRLLLTGTPLQNNLTELWALLQFLMSGTPFANLKDFGEWFSIPLEKAIEQGNVQDEEVQLQVSKLHTVLRPYLLRRLKRDVEKELPSKYEHLVSCRLSKRQRFLYDEFMSRSQTREDLKSGVYQKIANILMQLRKVCNHPDLFEVRPIVTSFVMDRSAISDFEIKELLIRRRLLQDDDQFSHLNFDVLGLQLTHLCNTSLVVAQETRSLEEILAAELIAAYPGEPPPRDTRTIDGYRKYNAYQRRLANYDRISQMVYLNRLRCNRTPIYGLETINIVRKLYNPLTPSYEAGLLSNKRQFAKPLIRSLTARAEDAADIIDRFAFATPAVVARDLPYIALREMSEGVLQNCTPEFDAALHKPSVKLQIAFPDVSLLQYDCGKLQELARLLRERKTGGHRVLIFTQMTRILDILETFLNFHGYLYLRLDGATKIEDRQYITERFNVDERVFAFIASSRSGGVGINLTGADTVIFYDSDFNPQMDRQCEDRAHRIGQIRDVHIYRFISQHTVEEAMLRKANQKRSLDDIVIQQGEFDWRNFFRSDEDGQVTSASALQKALVEFEDFEDSHAARVAAREEATLAGEDRVDFGEAEAATDSQPVAYGNEAATPVGEPMDTGQAEDEDAEGGTTIDFMLKIVRSDREFFREWKLT